MVGKIKSDLGKLEISSQKYTYNSSFEFSADLSSDSIPFIPVSGRHGGNLIELSNKSPWCQEPKGGLKGTAKGVTVVEAIDMALA